MLNPHTFSGEPLFLAKIRVSFINQIRNQQLLKIAPYRHPKFGGFRKKPYLCTIIQKKTSCMN